MLTGNTVRWITRRPTRPAEAPPRFNPADFDPPLQTRLLVLQPTPFCNIRCSYCYLPDRDSKARMNVITARQAVQRLRDDGLLGPTLTVVWHAGEPLTMPICFYASAFDAVHQAAGPACQVTHAVQTNAMLINDDWCRLFLQHGVRVGVSVDGPADLHDAHRRTRHGHATHARVLAGMARLRAHGIAFHAIAVVSAATLGRVADFAAFFEQQGVQELGCNFDEAEGHNTQSSLVGREQAHADFLAQLFARSAASGGALRVRELARAARLVAQPLPQTQWRGVALPDNAQTLPFAIVNVAWNGDFGCFSPELLGQPSAEFAGFVLGNVASSGYFESAQRQPFTGLWSAILRGVEACRGSCAYFDFCGGGSPVNKFYENGDLGSAETLFCRSMVKRPFDLALGRAEALRAAQTAAKTATRTAAQAAAQAAAQTATLATPPAPQKARRHGL